MPSVGPSHGGFVLCGLVRAVRVLSGLATNLLTGGRPGGPFYFSVSELVLTSSSGTLTPRLVPPRRARRADHSRAALLIVTNSSYLHVTMPRMSESSPYVAKIIRVPLCLVRFQLSIT